MIKVVGLIKKRADLSTDEFISYYENKHVKLIQSLIPHLDSYRRSYIMFDDPRTYLGPFILEGDTASLARPDFDVLTEVTFVDRDTFEDFFDAMQAPEAARLIAEDEENFIDRPYTRTLVVEEHVTM